MDPPKEVPKKKAQRGRCERRTRNKPKVQFNKFENCGNGRSQRTSGLEIEAARRHVSQCAMATRPRQRLWQKKRRKGVALVRFDRGWTRHSRVSQTCCCHFFDAGAAVSTVPRKDFEGYISGEPRTTKYKTASGELLENHDHGQVKLYGTDQDYEDKSMTARVTDVHKILASGSEVCKKNLVVLDSNGGTDNPG